MTLPLRKKLKSKGYNPATTTLWKKDTVSVGNCVVDAGEFFGHTPISKSEAQTTTTLFQEVKRYTQ